MVTLSVIIPIYNTAPYLERCVVSLMEQTIETGIEFIFVNDCSTDNSIELLQSVIARYPQRKDQILLLSTPQNSGLGAARALGLQSAKGDYITHCDSDDWVAADAYQTIIDKIEECKTNIIVSDFYVESQQGVTIINYPEQSIAQRLISGHWWMQWSHTVRRSFLYEHGLSTIAGIDFWEDMDLLMRVYHFAGSIAYIHKPLYHYCRNNTHSLSSSTSISLLGPCQRVIDHLTDFYQDQKACPPFRFYALKQFTRDLYLSCDPIDWTSWHSLYPDSWRYLWRDSRFKFLYRVTYTLASLGFSLPFRIYLNCSKKKRR